MKRYLNTLSGTIKTTKTKIMLRVYLKLIAKKDIPKSGWKEGDICQLENDIFNEKTGIAYHPIDSYWEILKMEVREYKMIHK